MFKPSKAAASQWQAAAAQESKILQINAAAAAAAQVRPFGGGGAATDASLDGGLHRGIQGRRLGSGAGSNVAIASAAAPAPSPAAVSARAASPLQDLAIRRQMSSEVSMLRHRNLMSAGVGWLSLRCLVKMIHPASWSNLLQSRLDTKSEQTVDQVAGTK